MYQQVATAGRPTAAAISLLERSSPSSVASRIDVPTLLIQGEQDSLFGLDQANANYQAIRRGGAPVGMVWFAGGHDGGNQETSQVNQLTEQWFDRWLKPGTTAGVPAFAVSRELGFDAFDRAGAARRGHRTALPRPGRDPARRGRPARARADHHQPAGRRAAGHVGAARPGSSPPATGGMGLPMPGQSAAFTSAPLAAPLQQTGSATVRVRLSGAADITVFATVYDVDQAGNATLPSGLAAPVRVTSGANSSAPRTVTVTLPAMDYQFAAGHRLRLVLTSTDFGYATSGTAAAYRVALAAPGLSVPSDPALRITGRRRGLVDLGRAGRRAGRGGGDPAGPAAAPAGLVRTRLSPTCRWRSPA